MPTNLKDPPITFSCSATRLSTTPIILHCNSGAHIYTPTHITLSLDSSFSLLSLKNGLLPILSIWWPVAERMGYQRIPVPGSSYPFLCAPIVVCVHSLTVIAVSYLDHSSSYPGRGGDYYNAHYGGQDRYVPHGAHELHVVLLTYSSPTAHFLIIYGIR